MNVSKSVLTVAATLCGLLCGCGGSSAGERSAPAERATRKNISLIEGVSPLYGATVPQGSVQRIGFRLRAGAEADSVVLYMGERRVAALDTAGYPYEVSAAHPTRWSRTGKGGATRVAGSSPCWPARRPCCTDIA